MLFTLGKKAQNFKLKLKALIYRMRYDKIKKVYYGLFYKYYQPLHLDYIIM